MTSPAFSINGNPSNTKASVTAGGAVTAILDSTVGVRSVTWTLVRTDETTVAGDYVLVQSGAVGQQCDTTALVAGTSAVLQCTINGGIDYSTMAPSDAMTSFVKFYVPTSPGAMEVLNAGELEDDNRESSATHGAVDPLNKVIRAAAMLAGSYKDPVRAATTAALAANTFDPVAGTITINAVGALAAQDGVTLTVLQDLLVKNEGGGTSAANGLYSLTTVGDGATQAVLTRRTDSDVTGELIAGTLVPVTEGTVNAEQLFILSTNDPIVVNTTALTFVNWGVVSPLVTAALRGTVNVLGAANTVLTTNGATAGGAWATIVNANVAAAAAIAGTKIAPDFGGQAVVTTSSIAGGTLNASGGTAANLDLFAGSTAAVSPAGHIRLRNNTNVLEVSINGGAYTPVRIGTAEAPFAFRSPSGGGATFYAGGFYKFGAVPDDFNPPIAFGTALSAYAAFIGFVCDVTPGTDTAITITGTSISDAGVRQAADTEIVTFLSADAANTYRQSTKRWIGQVQLAKTAGADRLCNYLFVSCYDHGGQSFLVHGIEAYWLDGANDAGINIQCRHHKATGWTYNAGAPPTPPTAITNMATEYGAESDAVNGEQGNYHRHNLSVTVNVSAGEGMMFELTTTGASAFTSGTAIIMYNNA